MNDLSKKDRGCWLAFGHAPEGTTMRAANDAMNAYVADDARGLALFHDHFADRPGGVALFAVETAAELAALREPGPLAGWDLHLHPLDFREQRAALPVPDRLHDERIPRPALHRSDERVHRQ